MAESPRAAAPTIVPAVVPAEVRPAEVDKVRPVERLRRVFAYTRPYRGRLVAALACLFIASGLGLVHPYFFG